MQNEYVNNIYNVENNKSQSTVMKIIIVLGVLLFLIIIIYLMYHFFVKKSDITCNYSTDKKMEYITLNGKEEVITTQKYIGCYPDYTMRYDVELFEVFKYNDKDIFKLKDDERVAIVIKEIDLPITCDTAINIDSITCHITEGETTDVYYMSKNNKNYEIMVKLPESNEYQNKLDSRINYMISTFAVNTKNGNI